MAAAAGEIVMVYGGECTHLLSESPRLYCAAPTTWAHYDRGGELVLAVLCDAHRTPTSRRIADDAPRSAPSEFLLKR